MAGVRSMLTRVQRLEAARDGRSPIDQMYGSFAAFEAMVEAGMDSGVYDRSDMSVVLASISSWHEQRLFDMWRRNRIWERSA